jgi:hypothetical protein
MEFVDIVFGLMGLGLLGFARLTRAWEAYAGAQQKSARPVIRFEERKVGQFRVMEPRKAVREDWRKAA